MKTDIVSSVFDAYRSKDRALIERVLADDFTFTSPYDDAIDKATYFERCWPTSELIKMHDIEIVAEHHDDTIVQYKCALNDGKEFRNVEVWTIVGERIRAINVYFGAAYRGGKFIKQR
jgi:ketosteroid isomerase-like protein